MEQTINFHVSIYEWLFTWMFIYYSVQAHVLTLELTIACKHIYWLWNLLSHLGPDWFSVDAWVVLVSGLDDGVLGDHALVLYPCSRGDLAVHEHPVLTQQAAAVNQRQTDRATTITTMKTNVRKTNPPTSAKLIHSCILSTPLTHIRSLSVMESARVLLFPCFSSYWWVHFPRSVLIQQRLNWTVRQYKTCAHFQ